MLMPPDVTRRTAADRTARLRDEAARHRSTRSTRSARSATASMSVASPTRSPAARPSAGPHYARRDAIASPTWLRRVARLFALALPSH